MTLMTIVVLVGIAFLLSINLYSVFAQKAPPEGVLKYNYVRGVEIVHLKTPYTLNFAQQKQVISLLNSAENMTATVAPTSFEFEQLTFYLFDAPDAILKPIANDAGSFIFSFSTNNGEKIFKEKTPGSFLALLSQTYDLNP